MELAVPIFVLLIILVGVTLFLRRQRPSRAEQLKQTVRAGDGMPADDFDVVTPRPAVAEMHVVGEEARVRFSVPLPEEPDEVLIELLVSEAVEVIREKRHTLPMDGVTAVVALSGSSENPVVVGRASLETPGELPPPAAAAAMLNLSHLAADPVERSFLDHSFDKEAEPEIHVETVSRVPEDELEAVGSFLKLPRAIDTGLRAQGIDPATMSSGELVTGMLALVGYQVQPTVGEGTWTATKAGSTTYVREDAYTAGDHPEIEVDALRRFLFEFAQANADRGLYVSDKYGPFEVYDLERRDPRIRVITRERLQKFVDALALS
jgi:hypothetical protein